MSRCTYCKKKLGISEYKCKCEKLFCITHLQPELHNCNYDHKKDGLELLKKQLEIGPLTSKIERF
jgi:hypothetical protein